MKKIFYPKIATSIICKYNIVCFLFLMHLSLFAGPTFIGGSLGCTDCWSVPSNWACSAVPTSNQNVTLAANLRIDISVTYGGAINTNGYNVLVDSGVTFDPAGINAQLSSVITNNGTLQIALLYDSSECQNNGIIHSMILHDQSKCFNNDTFIPNSAGTGNITLNDDTEFHNYGLLDNVSLGMAYTTGQQMKFFNYPNGQILGYNLVSVAGNFENQGLIEVIEIRVNGLLDNKATGRIDCINRFDSGFFFADAEVINEGVITVFSNTSLPVHFHNNAKLTNQVGSFFRAETNNKYIFEGGLFNYGMFISADNDLRAFSGENYGEIHVLDTGILEVYGNFDNFGLINLCNNVSNCPMSPNASGALFNASTGVITSNAGILTGACNSFVLSTITNQGQILQGCSFAPPIPSGNCPINYIGLNGVLSSNTTYDTDGIITTSQIISSSGSPAVIYDSAHYIIWGVGFETQSGTDVSAIIDGCN